MRMETSDDYDRTNLEHACERTFASVRQRYDIQKVTVGHLIQLTSELPSGSDERFEAGITAYIMFKSLVKDKKFDLLEPVDVKAIGDQMLKDAAA